ncbi:MAG: hypothetical protein EZS28_018536, partial [Streblomastix strix]
MIQIDENSKSIKTLYISHFSGSIYSKAVIYQADLKLKTIHHLKI